MSRHSQNSGISNHEISSILNPACKGFAGVFSADTIPSSLVAQKNFSIVCNLSKAGKPGSHFVTLIDRERYILYIDSLGLPCVTPTIKHFLEKKKKPVFYNKTQIQHLSSKFCGFFCILFVLYFDREWEEPLIFSKNLLRNDRVCIKKILEILNKPIY